MPAPHFDTVVLRFRDLVTPEGGTVQLHQGAITASAATPNRAWWGWWSKGGERVPSEAFREINAKARADDGLTIYLFDSGTASFYRATCSRVQFADVPEERMQSPNPDDTPGYYAGESYLAWFELTSIDEARSEDVVGAYTYVEVPEFFDTGESHFGRFDGKVVASSRELRLQDRTIWFVRTALATDPTHEIELYGAQTTYAEHFPSTYMGRGRSHLLWLSDLHFGDYPDEFAFPPTIQGGARPLWVALESAIARLNIDVAGVILSGDFANRARREGFTAATAFVRELAGKLRISPYDFLICPGNHDFGFSAVPEEPTGGVAPMTEAEHAAAYNEFYKALFNVAPNEHYASGRRFLLRGGYAVELVALNSVVLQQDSEFRGQGFVGPEQREYVERQSGWTQPGGDPPDRPAGRTVRIVVLHHHLVPVTYSESTTRESRYSLTLDAEAVTRWALRHGASAVLHGHMHQPSFVYVQRPTQLLTPGGSGNVEDMPRLAVCGLGSTGAARAELGEVARNVFGLLSFEGERMRIQMHTLDPQVAEAPAQVLASVSIPLRTA